MKDDNPKDFNFKFPDDTVPVNFSTWAAAINNETESLDPNLSTSVKTGAKLENSNSYTDLLANSKPDLLADAKGVSSSESQTEEVQLSLFVHESEFYIEIPIKKIRAS